MFPIGFLASTLLGSRISPCVRTCRVRGRTVIQFSSDAVPVMSPSKDPIVFFATAVSSSLILVPSFSPFSPFSPTGGTERRGRSIIFRLQIENVNISSHTTIGRPDPRQPLPSVRTKYRAFNNSGGIFCKFYIFLSSCPLVMKHIPICSTECALLGKNKQF